MDVAWTNYSNENLGFGKFLCDTIYKHGFTLINEHSQVNHYRPKAQANGKQFDLLNFLGFSPGPIDYQEAHKRFTSAITNYGGLSVERIWSDKEEAVLYDF